MLIFKAIEKLLKMVKIEHSHQEQEWQSLLSLLASEDDSNYQLAKLLIAKKIQKQPIFRLIESLRKGKEQNAVLGKVLVNGNVLVARYCKFHRKKKEYKQLEFRCNGEIIGFLVSDGYEWLENVSNLLSPQPDKIGLFT